MIPTGEQCYKTSSWLEPGAHIVSIFQRRPSLQVRACLSLDSYISRSGIGIWWNAESQRNSDR